MGTSRVTTQIVVLYLLETGLIALLVFGAGMAPAAAAVLAVGMFAGTVYTVSANPVRLLALSRATLGSAEGWV